MDAEDTDTFVWSLNDHMFMLKKGMVYPKKQQLSGVVGSLARKGLVDCDTVMNRNDSLISLTEDGFKYWKENLQPLPYQEDEWAVVVAE